MPLQTDQSTLILSHTSVEARGDGRDEEISDPLPSPVTESEVVDQLVETARKYARQAATDNTLKVYARDWAHCAWSCWKNGAEQLPLSPEMIGLYLADLVSGSPPLPLR